MELRDQLAQALKEAMLTKDADRLPTLRLINATLKDREIEERGKGKDVSITDADVLAILAKMVKQRQESAHAYEEGGRLELAEKEQEEIKVIEAFLPKQLSDEETNAAIDAAIAQTGAGSIRDMGAVMGALKAKYTGQIDFGKVGGMVKEKLG